MAFAVGAIVTEKVNSTALAAGLAQRQPPALGVVAVDQGAGAYTVLWDDGLLQAGIPGVPTLDELIDADANEVSRLSGRVVRVQETGQTSSESAAYDAKVIMQYRRRTEDGATTSTDRALVQMIQSGAWRELNSADLQPVRGM